MPPRLPGLIVFDLDGTLVDSRRDLATTANHLIAELGGTALDESTIGAMIGDGVRLLVERALIAGCGLGQAPAGAVSRFQELYSQYLLETTLPYREVHATLDRLSRRVPLAVLTNKPQRPSLAILEGLGLRAYFGEVTGGDLEWPRKPDPRGLLHLVREAGTSASDVLMVGDSGNDLRTARNAGTGIALARYGYGYDTFPKALLRGDEVLLDSPAELLAYLAGRRLT